MKSQWNHVSCYWHLYQVVYHRGACFDDILLAVFFITCVIFKKWYGRLRYVQLKEAASWGCQTCVLKADVFSVAKGYLSARTYCDKELCNFFSTESLFTLIPFKLYLHCFHCIMPESLATFLFQHEYIEYYSRCTNYLKPCIGNSAFCLIGTCVSTKELRSHIDLKIGYFSFAMTCFNQ